MTDELPEGPFKPEDVRALGGKHTEFFDRVALYCNLRHSGERGAEAAKTVGEAIPSTFIVKPGHAADPMSTRRKYEKWYAALCTRLNVEYRPETTQTDTEYFDEVNSRIQDKNEERRNK